MWEPRPLATLGASMACKGISLTLLNFARSQVILALEKDWDLQSWLKKDSRRYKDTSKVTRIIRNEWTETAFHS
jgi:hypothetical protein